MSLPDYSEWLTPERLEVEEGHWAREALHVARAIRLLEVCGPGEVSVLEIGCGTGWIPTVLPPRIRYTGLDANPHCIGRAIQKNPDRLFVLADIRAAELPRVDVVCSFSVMKHFGLHEWESIWTRKLSAAARCLSSILIANDEPFDDGEEYPHTWVSDEMLQRASAAAGHVVVRKDVLWSGSLGVEVKVETAREA